MDYRIQQQLLGSNVSKSAQSSETVEDDSESSIKDGRNGMGPGINVQGGGTVGVTIWKQELVGDQGDAQGPDSITQSGGATYHKDDGET